jgi:hypothetical protein
MLEMSENSSLDRSTEGYPSASLAGGLKDVDQVTQGTIPTGELIGPIFTKTFFISLIAALLFTYLGSSNILAPFDVQAQRLVSVLAWIWPTLPRQYELVRQVQGVGQSASYGFMSGALWAWPVICAVAYVREHVKCQKVVLPLSPKEICGIAVMFPFAVLELIFDPTRVASPLFGFPIKNTVLLYLRQWFLFASIAFVLGSLFYVLGRTILVRTRAD